MWAGPGRVIASRAIEATSLIVLTVGACTLLEPTQRAGPYLLFDHEIRLDREGNILGWWPQDSPYAHVARLAWNALETKFPLQENGLETWLTYSRFDPDTFEGIAWPHNPAGFYAMLTDSALLWYEFSGDRAAVDMVHKMLAHQLAHGTTPADWDWARVPFASAAAGDVDYGGADDTWCDFCGRGDGIGVIEPDKVGELGLAYLRMFEMRGEISFRDAATACADALAKHVRDGDETSSPWPFRVYAETNVVRERYSSNVVYALTLFDELAQRGIGQVGDYQRAREIALRWLLRVPMANDAWSGYFEDVDMHADPTVNPNQYSALSVARWLMAHPSADPRWREHVSHLLSWVADTFGGDTPGESGHQWGAAVMSEQRDDTAKMASHTARFGATLALWYEATGDAGARDLGARSLNWATYACRDDGIVSVSQDENEGWWFSDGYGDYIRHFLVAMAAVPDWAPRREDHLLRSTSVVTRVDYAPSRVAWRTFDDDSSETLRLTFAPASVVFAGAPIERRASLDAEGYTVRPLRSGGFLVQVRHSGRGEVIVSGASH
jgi:hypothetical protein